MSRSPSPKKGQIPHDAIHLIVERHLGLHTAFWGRVAAGSDPKEVGLIAATVSNGTKGPSRLGLTGPKAPRGTALRVLKQNLRKQSICLRLAKHQFHRLALFSKHMRKG